MLQQRHKLAQNTWATRTRETLACAQMNQLPRAPHSHLVERRDVSRGISRVERPLDVLERRVHHLVRVREAVDPARPEVDEDVVPVLHAVRVGVRVAPPPLEVLPADQARIHVVVR